MLYVRKFAIILLGGEGLRFGGDAPKQYMPFRRKPLFFYAISKFNFDSIDGYVIVSDPKYNGLIEDYARSHGVEKPITFAPAGKNRQESVFNALSSIKEEDTIVLIHDGDRPNINRRIIKNNIKAVEDGYVALTAVKINDSIFKGEEEMVSSYLDRKDTYRAQTPQSFLLKDILKFHKTAREEGLSFHDDASLAFHYGMKAKIIEGSVTNIKITTKDDLKLLERIIDD